MNDRSYLCVPFAVALSLTLVPEASAQVPAGGEFRVNTYTTSAQRRSAVVKRSEGDFVVAWHSYGPDGSLYGIRGQRFDAAGAAVGGEFQVNTYTTEYQYWPRMAVNARDAFVVTWSSYGQDGSYWGAFGQRYGADGVAQGAEFRVNTYTTGYQWLPVPSMAANGSFVVVWNSFYPGQDGSYGTVIGRRYDNAGSPVGGEFQVNTYTTGYQIYGTVGTAPNGSFVVAWQSPQDGDGYGIIGRRYDAAGAPVGGEFIINTSTTGNQLQPAIAVSRSGGFVVIWNSPDGSSYGVRGRLFDAAGSPVGGDFAVNTYTTGIQYGYHHVAADAQGNFVVTWASSVGDGSAYGIFGQRFASTGTRRGAEFQVNTYTTDDQSMATVALDPVGNFDISWRSFGQDGSLSGVYAQRYGGLLPSALRVDTPAGGGTGDGNLVWEPGESPDVRPSWLNLNGAAQTIAGTLTNITGPSGPTYSIPDGAADYGTIANGAAGEATNPYQVGVTGPRPSLHWDASALETLTPDTQGQQKRWALHIGGSFSDVSTSSPFYRFIETLLHNSITGGCTATEYCPGNSTTREQMAVFVLVAKEGPGYTPPACTTPVFNDVPAASPFCRFIEELAGRGVVAGCGGGAYCPGSPVLRDQMAVFVLRTLDPTLTPPACVAGSEMFADLPATSPFCRWVEELARRGVVTGCAPGLYCPSDAVTREQMGVFISVTFGLTLYGV
jgi:hypothetical protein